jgi:hypothetical protein
MYKYIIHQINISKYLVFNGDIAIKYKGRKGRFPVDCKKPQNMPRMF